MDLEKITLKIYHPEVKEFIEKGWLEFREEYDVIQAKMSENFIEEQIKLALERYSKCLKIQSVFKELLPHDQIFDDILLAASFFCDLYRYSPKGENCPEYCHLIGIGELERITLGANQMPIFSTKWWPLFKKCLLYCMGTNNPLKMLNFDRPVSELDVIFTLGFQLHAKESSQNV